MRLQISTIIALIGMIVAAVVYAEETYVRKGDIYSRLKQMQVEQYQVRIDVLNNAKAHEKLNPTQRWELEYFKDKRDNLQKGGQ